MIFFHKFNSVSPSCLAQQTTMRFVTLPHLIVQKLKDLNLFSTSSPTEDPIELQTQRISTRLFILSLTFSFTILVVYTSTRQVIKTIKIANPTIDQYDALYRDHGEILSCPCTQISVPYSTFIRINYTLHQVCQSIYVTKEFIEYMDSVAAIYDDPQEFLLGGSATFQALMSLCQLSQQTIEISLRSFLKRQYISTVVTAAYLLETQFEMILQQFMSSMIQELLLSMRSIRAMIQINALVPAMFTNYNLAIWFALGHGHRIDVRYDNNCSCAQSAQCKTQAVIYLSISRDSFWIVPGFYRGCLLFESLLLSTLECFFDHSCITTFHASINSNIIMNTMSLNASASKKFLPNTTIAEIFENLMVDEWYRSTVHADYYYACRPKECAYDLIVFNDVIYIVTTVVGLIGGLVPIIKLILPFLVRRILSQIRKYSRNTIRNIS